MVVIWRIQKLGSIRRLGEKIEWSQGLHVWTRGTFHMLTFHEDEEFRNIAVFLAMLIAVAHALGCQPSLRVPRTGTWLTVHPLQILSQSKVFMCAPVESDS